jgi:hypothetical protein
MEPCSKPRGYQKDFASGLLAIAVSFAVTVGCAPKAPPKTTTSASIVKECTMESGQSNSLQGHWASTPIKISMHSGDWQSSEVSNIQAAADTWNNFYRASKGFATIDYGPGGTGYISNLSQTAPTCGGVTLTDGTVLYKRYSGWTKSGSAIAVTTTCFTPSSSGLAKISNAIIEFNYVNYFVTGTNHYPDLQSIATHELGHLHGLDHSCGPLGAPNQSKANISCPDPSTDSSSFLFSSIMFPTWYFDSSTGSGQIKHDLSSNDEGRANCLY